MKRYFVILLLCSAIVTITGEANSKKLVQVVVLSRHNVRTPIAMNLASMTPKSWPQWNEKNGFLTGKGFKLEGYMGKFFSEWLRDKHVLPISCPTENEVFVYANVKQRTRQSAKAFVDSAFPGCNVTVHHNKSDKMDPIFNPIIHNDSVIFRQLAMEQMKTSLRSLQLNDSYNIISEVLDYKDSFICKMGMKCNLATDPNKIINVVKGMKPNILGPLKIGNSVLDAFLMQYYEGFPINTVAWGELNEGNWKTVMKLSHGYHNVIFNTKIIADDIAKPMIKYLKNIFENPKPSFILLMGHDANMYTLLKALDFKPYVLPKQNEITPVGSKIVFQKWHDKEKKLDYLKIDYVYGSFEQMRNGDKLSLSNPPQFKALEINGCEADQYGFCLWSDFVKLLHRLAIPTKT